MEFIKPNDQLQFSDIELFDCIGWEWPLFSFNDDFEWCPFWLIDGFLIWLTDDGISDGGNLIGGFGLNWK